MSADARDVVISGHIAGAYGVQGWVRVSSYTDPVDSLLDYRPWLVEQGREWVELELLEARRHQKGIVARFAECRDRNAAEALRGAKVAVTPASLPALEDGEFYWRDLIGLDVIDQQDKRLGAVAEMIATGAHDVMVVRDADGSEARLIPFVAQFVTDVRPAERRIRVDWED